VDRITEMLDSLADLSDEQVAELKQTILSEFDSVEKQDPTPQTVDAMTALADALDAVRGEMSSREAAQAELAQRAAEAASRVRDGEAAAEEAEMTEAQADETVAEIEAEDAAEAAAPVEDEVPVEDEAPAEDEEAPAEEAPADEDEDEVFSAASTEADEVVELATESEDAVVELSTDTDEVVELATEEAPAEEATVEEIASIELSTDDEVSTEAVVEAVAEAAVEDSSSTTEAQVEAALEIMEAPVTAAAENADNLDIEVPADRRPVAKATATVAITAGADIPGISAGQNLNDLDAVAEAYTKRLNTLRRVNGGDGEQHIVASLTTNYPEERMLSTDALDNAAKIANVVGAEALVASGGHAAPLEVKYDIFGFGTTVRPVRDSLPRFQADRGGIRYVTPPALSGNSGAVGVWTAANDVTPSSPTEKAVLTVTAAAEQTASTDAITLQLQFGNLMTRAYPELVARHNELGLIRHARLAESTLLSGIAAGSTAVTSTSLIGFARDFLVQISRAAAAYRSRHRLEADTVLRVIAPSWVFDAMQSDLALSMPGDGTLSVARAEIEGYLRDRNVTAVWSLDADVFGAQGAAAMLEFPDSFTWYLFAEGTFLFLDGGTLDLGIVRDSTLVGTNDYRMFVETFEKVTKVGIESLAVTSTISVNGVAAALRDTTGAATAAAIEL